jgi:hypothetical protein
VNDDQVTRSIDEIEGALRQDDPAFLQRVDHLQRQELATFLSVLALLAAGAVLLTVGLATLSWPVWGAGLGTLVASVLVDEYHKHVVRRWPDG